ncbi:hypothetical protein BKI52_21425 [marine bacterium AO1-C]|nr:hypothetical protein BKI52_21425 [marine bacterium AO1-C]
MNKNPMPSNETSRLEALKSLNILDTEAEEEFDALTAMVSQMIDIPMAFITFIDEKRQWIKSKSVPMDISETPREISFCQHAIMQDAVYEVNNAIENELFKDNPMVVNDPNVRFYAGMPLKTSDGFNLGTICVIDNKPRQLTQEHRQVLQEYAREVVQLVESRRRN